MCRWCHFTPIPTFKDSPDLPSVLQSYVISPEPTQPLSARLTCVQIEGTTEYTTCSGLLTASSSVWPQSALFQIAASGVALNKLVIGKPGISSDASNGFIDPSVLAGCLAQAKAKGWSAGAMVWEVCKIFQVNRLYLVLGWRATLPFKYPDAGSTWIQTVRSQSFP